MSLSLTMKSEVDVCKFEYEAIHGKTPDSAAMKVVEHIAFVAEQLEKLGLLDATRGYGVRSKDVFIELVSKVFDVEASEYEGVQAIANLWEMYYLDGYEKGDEEK